MVGSQSEAELTRIHDCMLLLQNLRLQLVRTLHIRRDRLPLRCNNLGKLPLRQLLARHRQLPLFTHLRPEENPRILRPCRLEVLVGAGERAGGAGGGAGGVGRLSALGRLRLRRAVIYRVRRWIGVRKAGMGVREDRRTRGGAPVRSALSMTRWEKLFALCRTTRISVGRAGRARRGRGRLTCHDARGRKEHNRFGEEKTLLRIPKHFEHDLDFKSSPKPSSPSLSRPSN